MAEEMNRERRMSDSLPVSDSVARVAHGDSVADRMPWKAGALSTHLADRATGGATAKGRKLMSHQMARAIYAAPEEARDPQAGRSTS